MACLAAAVRRLLRNTTRTRSFACTIVLAGVAMLVAPALAQPVKGEATLTAAGGYARLLVKLDEDVEADVATAGSILVIRFKRAIDVPMGRVADAVPDYVGSARADPDGSAIRLALARKVTVNAMAAGERLYVDLLPDGWSGAPPSLPQEVLKELSDRARAAERALREQRAAVKPRPPVRVRAAAMPTFVRFTFETPDGVAVSSMLADQKLTLQFAAPLTFDLADAKLTAPPNIASIGQQIAGNRSSVEIGLIGSVDVRSFQEDKNTVVDIGFQQPDKPRAAMTSEPPAADAGHGAPAEAMPKAAPGVSAAAPVAQGKPAPPPKPSLDSVKAAPPPDIAPVHSEPHAAIVAPPVANPPKTVPVASSPQAVSQSIAVKRGGDGLRLTLPVATTIPAALFRRADTVWLVLDDKLPVALDAVRTQAGSIVGDVVQISLERGQALRFRLNRPQLAALVADGPNWMLMLADSLPASPQPLAAIRNVSDPARANVVVALAGAGLLHPLADPEAGDAMLVVTAAAPAQSVVKRQDFVEFSLLESLHGVVVQATSDDLALDVAPDKVVITRPGGLSLSSAALGTGRGRARPLFDANEWQTNQQADFIARLQTLTDAAARAAGKDRLAARQELARFYFSRGLHHEAKGMLDLALSDQKAGDEDAPTLMMRAVAAVLIGRTDIADKDLANAAIGSNSDAQLWRALSLARQAKWADAREKFKNVAFVVNTLPLDLQRIVTAEAMRASLEVRDFAGAARLSGELDHVGVTPAMGSAVMVMRGRLAEALGNEAEAQADYREAMDSPDRAASSEARLLDIALRESRDRGGAAALLPELETLAVTWRGDVIEVNAQRMMARIYAAAGRYADALAAARTAAQLQPSSELARDAQDEAAELFARLFLGTKGDDLAPIDALSIFYEYRDLTPIGRRGDEMIRRLTERLVAVDLLDQASELLQYQVDNRLEGAARAQVAARLAMIYLMNRKPDRAIGALRSTRIADLSGELRQQRLLLEARAQSDVGRHDLALDIVSNVPGRETLRLRSDIYWASRRWREASEQIELYLGDRWRDFTPPQPAEKSDLIRAAVGYALADDAIGVARFREKFAPLMTGADKIAFDVAGAPASGGNAEFAAIAKMAASVDTLDGFIRDMKSRFSDVSARAVIPQGRADQEATGSLPRVVGAKRVEAMR